MPSPTRLLRNIDRALSRTDLTDEWRDALETARLEVLARYPQFNSKSTLPVTCPVCGTTREVRVLHLYNLVGMYECLTCHARRTCAAVPSDSRRECAKNATASHTPESYRKMVESRNPEQYRKMWVTRKSQSI